MRLKPKAARRLLLVGVLAILAVTAVVMLVVVRSWANERRTQQLRTDGIAAYEAGEYAIAQENLAKFLRRAPKDREAWLKLAESFEKVEKPQGKNLMQAAQAYARAWAIDDTDVKTGAALLKLYGQIDQAGEARDVVVAVGHEAGHGRAARLHVRRGRADDDEAGPAAGDVGVVVDVALADLAVGVRGPDVRGHVDDAVRELDVPQLQGAEEVRERHDRSPGRGADLEA